MSLYYGSKEVNGFYFGSKDAVSFYNGSHEVWSSEQPFDYEPFYIMNVGDTDGTVSLVASAETAPEISLDYSTDGETWSTWDKTETTIPKDERLYFKATTTNGAFSTGTYYNHFVMSDSEFTVNGNINSLIDGESYNSIVKFTQTYQLAHVFYNAENIVSAEGLKLPTKTLSNYCYYSLFANCSSLETAPELPAEQLAENCYQSMFSNCTSLTTAPELPLTSLASGCYMIMFGGCTSLTSIPELPALKVPQKAYYGMFKDCTSLTSVYLPATELVFSTSDGSYCIMFQNCSNLSRIEVDYNDDLMYQKTVSGRPRKFYAAKSWVSGVSETGTFICPEGMTETHDVDTIPEGWTVVRK